ncbi:hypothetical protein [Streptomyces sp. NPDC002599]
MSDRNESKAHMTRAEYVAWVVSRSRPLNDGKAQKIAALLRPVGGAVK